ncbi:LemA family protein [Phormidium pseudopriestleyi FRX01]|uniref:LemA family protein n=1 Tax=Phormidium pseudopriestleyi FRX01 TaxID=1759528 RepID=A0ABS3FX48_9CYAN|nr:LemA family protein [Phormidium pseudopriestleyi]MBO0351691.1 LemA family protein [Phormidium pseudopriestleyi FRX01]
MKDSNSQIPEDMAQEVLELASRYYSGSQNSYSLDQLQQAGSDVQIPPEFMEKAIQEVREKRRIEAQEQQAAQKRQKTVKMVAAGVGVAIALWGIFTYNSLSSSASNVEASWAQVENQFQRRADLIPNLVSLARVQTAAEQETIALLVRSRESYLQAQNLPQKQAANAEINVAINRFNQSLGTNPQLQSSQAYQNLSYELAGTENRIAVERMRYNQAVQAYNQKVGAFPNSLIAGLTGFSPKPFFTAENRDVPRID